MPRYIDVEKIEWNWMPLTALGEKFFAYADDVAKIPAEDVAPIVHAKWIVGKYCSNCEYDNTKICCEETKYCPNCGAKMDAGEE